LKDKVVGKRSNNIHEEPSSEVIEGNLGAIHAEIACNVRSRVEGDQDVEHEVVVLNFFDVVDGPLGLRTE